MAEDVCILLIDDDDIDVELIIRGFRRKRIANRIIRARDGLEGLEMLSTPGQVPEPYMILLDINMPRMNGHEFLARLRAEPSLHAAVVFVLTTSDADRDKMQAYACNVAGYIVKDHAGADFVSLVELLDHYWRIVELPAPLTG